MNPAIGLTSQVIRQAKWYKYIGELGFKTIEINRQNSKLHFNVFFLEKIKRYMEGFDLSIHSGTSGIFQDYGSFSEANLSILTAEVDVCRFLGARQFVFHINDGFISSADKNQLRKVLSYAADSGVEMLYESNSTLVGDYAFDILESFPNLGYVLDLGHLNNGFGRGALGSTIDDFVRQVRNRVVYVHASNNSGRRDEHNGLENGTLDWRRVLDLLDFSRLLKIIIEVRHIDMIEPSRTELRSYVEELVSAQKNCAIA